MIRAIKPHALIEAVIFPGLVVLYGFYFNQADPLYVHAGYPWLWIIPLLIALRYGLVLSLLSACIYYVACYYTIYYGYFDWSSYYVWLLGGTIVMGIGAEYHYAWQKRLFKQNERSQYLDKRLEFLSRSYSVMRISHDTLEEALIVKPITLRGALTSLRQHISENHGVITETSSKQLMAILVHVSNMNKANLYLMQGKTLLQTPIAAVGGAEPIDMQDPLVKKCFEEKEVVYIAANALSATEVSQYVAVIPMKTAANDIKGVLTIEELPYASMKEETLRILAVLLAYLADSLWAEYEGRDILAKYPQCPAFFASELNACLHLYQMAKLESTLFYYQFENNELGLSIAQTIQQQARGVDVLWQHVTHHIHLIILMPLTDISQIESYLTRVDQKLKSKVDISLQDARIHYKIERISAYPSLKALMEGLNQYAVN